MAFRSDQDYIFFKIHLVPFSFSWQIPSFPPSPWSSTKINQTQFFYCWNLPSLRQNKIIRPTECPRCVWLLFSLFLPLYFIASAMIAFGGKRREEGTGRRRGDEGPQSNQHLSVSGQEHEDWGICTPLWRCMATGREGPRLCLSCGARNSVTTAITLEMLLFNHSGRSLGPKDPHPKLRVLLTFPMASDKYQHTVFSTWTDCTAAGGAGVDRLVYAV